MSRVSVIIPIYNAAETVGECVDSLLNQNFDGEIEIVCVDNNSSDGGMERLPKDDRITRLSEPEQGAYASRNTGVSKAKGEYFLFTDPDCVAEQGWVAEHLNVLERAGVAITLGQVRHGGTGRALHLLSEFDHARQMVLFRARAVDSYFGYTNNLGIAKRAWGEVGPFAVRDRGADVILVHHTLKAYGARSVRYVPDAKVHHLEVDTLTQYWRKMYVYGRSARSYQRHAAQRPRTWKMRRRSTELALQRARASAADRCLLMASLGIGLAAYQAGYRWGHRLPHRLGVSAEAPAAD